jgi:hypothetical protein
MTDDFDGRDFFISFNSADKAYAEAIDAALRKERKAFKCPRFAQTYRRAVPR